jgi:glycosyltransferase involved in cell wall biosynthesis
MAKKRVLHLIETSEPGGAETVLAYIAKNLDAERFDSTVCVLEEGWLTQHLRELKVPFTVLANRRPYDPAFLLSLMRLAHKERIDILHSHEFMMSVYGSVAARLLRKPIVCTIHGKVYYPESRRRIRLLKLALALCSRMVAVSEDLKLFMRELMRTRSSKLVTLYNGIDERKFAPPVEKSESRDMLSIPRAALVAGTVGSLFEVKGLPYMFQAARILRDRFPGFILIIAGTGNQEESLRQLSTSLGLNDTVRFLGFRDDIPHVLNALDVYLCSSLSEGLSLSILEAMAMSKAVVATSVGGNPELVCDGHNGFLVSPRNPEALADRVGSLLSDSKLQSAMGSAGRRLVEDKFSLDTMIHGYQSMYLELLK